MRLSPALTLFLLIRLPPPAVLPIQAGAVLQRPVPCSRSDV